MNVQASIHSSELHVQENRIPRFQRLDETHIQALESIFKKYQFLQNRIEIHLPFQRAKQAFTSEKIWAWAKFDRKPATFLCFLEGFAPCVWSPDRQEGLTIRWLLPPSLFSKGPTICIANMLPGESVLQIEDILISEGKDLWSTTPFSKRWEELRTFWNKIPTNQPLLKITPKIVKPLSLDELSLEEDPTSHYWIFQHDNIRTPRWFWKDDTILQKTNKYIPPTLERKTRITVDLYALCKPYDKFNLPDTYNLYSQENTLIGIASIPNMEMSKNLKTQINQKGLIVKVSWNDEFSKYQITKIMPEDTPIMAYSFFIKPE